MASATQRPTRPVTRLRSTDLLEIRIIFITLFIFVIHRFIEVNDMNQVVYLIAVP
jgi:hypothetical protein